MSVSQDGGPNGAQLPLSLACCHLQLSAQLSSTKQVLQGQTLRLFSWNAATATT